MGMDALHKALVEALTDVEWITVGDGGPGWDTCPNCRAEKPYHGKGCKLREALDMACNASFNKRKGGAWEEIPWQVTHPRMQGGCDYGTARPVLAQKDTKIVEYRPGCTSWHKRGETKYSPSRLVLWESKPRNTSFPSPATDVFTGRVTKAKLKAASKQIAEFFGVPEAQLPPLDRHKTFVWKKT